VIDVDDFPVKLRGQTTSGDASVPRERLASTSPATAEHNGHGAGPRATFTHEQTLEVAERDYLVNLIKTHAGNVSEAARQAKLSRQGLHKLLKKHAICAAEFR